MPTPLLNLAVAKTLLDQDRSPEAVEQVYDLVAKAVKQQEKATSQRLESDPALCRSSQYKPPRDRSPQDVGSRTSSSERRRRDARNRKDAIPISSDHGERAQPRRPSPSPRSPRRQEDYKAHHRTDMPPPKQCGIVIRDNAEQTHHDRKHNEGHKSRSHHDPPRPTSNPDRREASRRVTARRLTHCHLRLRRRQADTMAEEARVVHAAHPLLTKRRRTRSCTMHIRGSIRFTRPGKDHTWDHVALDLQYGLQLTPKVSGLTRPSSPITAPPRLPHGCSTTATRWRLPEATPTSPSSTSR